MAGGTNGGFNVNQAASRGLQASMVGTGASMGYNPTSSDIQGMMNPYTENVISTAQNDLERQRQMTMNSVGASATAAGAFGGDRHGIVEAETNRGYADAGAKMAAGLRAQGFDNAQEADRRNEALRLGAAGQMGNLANQAFQTGRTINSDLSQQGALQQSLMQQIINGANQQYSGWTGAPQTALNLPLAALGSAPYGSTTTSTSQSNPGFFDYLTAGSKFASGFF